MEQEGEVSGTTLSRQESDAVSHPSHYTGGGIEAKDALKSAMAGSGLSPMASYWRGCAFKFWLACELRDAIW